MGGGASSDGRVRERLAEMRRETVQRNLTLGIDATKTRRILVAMVQGKASRDDLRSTAKELRDYMVQIRRNNDWLKRCKAMERAADAVSDQRGMMESMEALTRLMQQTDRNFDIDRIKDVSQQFSKLSTKTELRQEAIDELIDDNAVDPGASVGVGVWEGYMETEAEIAGKSSGTDEEERAFDAFLASVCRDASAGVPVSGTTIMDLDAKSLGLPQPPARDTGPVRPEIAFSAPSPPQDADDGGYGGAGGGGGGNHAPRVVVDPALATDAYEARLAALRAASAAADGDASQAERVVALASVPRRQTAASAILGPAKRGTP